MENVQFDEESVTHRAPVAAARAAGMSGFLIKKGWVKDEKGAQYILIGIAVIAFIISLFFWSGIFGDAEQDPRMIPPNTNPSTMR